MAHNIDTRGFLCPLPVLKTQKRIRSLKSGEVLTVISDDPAAWLDIPHYCVESGNILVEQLTLDDGSACFRVKKK